MARVVRRELSIDLKRSEPPSVRAILDEPAGAARGSALLFAHGAELDLDSDFMTAMAAGLAARGFPVLRFRYSYMERRAREGRRRPPDRAPVLEEAHFAALAFLRGLELAPRALLAGKSMGARIATHIAAKGADAAGLVLLGYPLHPAGKPDEERKEHFPAIVQPALFVQGTRDPLCRLERLRLALARWAGAAEVHVVEGGDHSFDVPVRSGRTRDEVRAQVLDAIDAWERRAFPD